MKHVRTHLNTLELLPKDLPKRRTARVRERAESIALLSGIAAFWMLVFVLNFFVGQASTPLLR